MSNYQSSINQMLGMAAAGAFGMKQTGTNIFEKGRKGASDTTARVSEATTTESAKVVGDLAEEPDAAYYAEQAEGKVQEAVAAERAKIDEEIAAIAAARPEGVIPAAAYDKQHPMPSDEEIAKRIRDVEEATREAYYEGVNPPSETGSPESQEEARRTAFRGAVGRAMARTTAPRRTPKPQGLVGTLQVMSRKIANHRQHRTFIQKVKEGRSNG